MARYKPTPRHIHEVLLFLFNQEIEVGEVRSCLTKVYGEAAIGEKVCSDSYKHFKDGDFQTENEKKNVQMLLDLKIFERRLCICEILLERQEREGFLHNIVAGGKTIIPYGNASSTSTAVLHIWWDHLGVVYYRVFKSIDEASNYDYKKEMNELREQLKANRMQYAGRREKVILQHEDDEHHYANVINNFQQSRWEVLPHPPSSPDIAPTYYRLFEDMNNNMRGKRFQSVKEVKNWIKMWLNSKTPNFFERMISELPKKWKEVVEKNGNYLET